MVTSPFCSIPLTLWFAEKEQLARKASDQIRAEVAGTVPFLFLSKPNATISRERFFLCLFSLSLLYHASLIECLWYPPEHISTLKNEISKLNVELDESKKRRESLQNDMSDQKEVGSFFPL